MEVDCASLAVSFSCCRLSSVGASAPRMLEHVRVPCLGYARKQDRPPPTTGGGAKGRRASRFLTAIEMAPARASQRELSFVCPRVEEVSRKKATTEDLKRPSDSHESKSINRKQNVSLRRSEGSTRQVRQRSSAGFWVQLP